MLHIESPRGRSGIPEKTVSELDRTRSKKRDEEKKRKRSSEPFCDRPLCDIASSLTAEGRHLDGFLKWATESVGRDERFAQCVRQLLVPELADAFLAENENLNRMVDNFKLVAADADAAAADEVHAVADDKPLVSVADFVTCYVRTPVEGGLLMVRDVIGSASLKSYEKFSGKQLED